MQQFSSDGNIAHTRSFSAMWLTCWVFFPRHESQRTDNGGNKDPAELDNAQQRLFHLVQPESFDTEKCCLLRSSLLSKSPENVVLPLFIGPNGLLRAFRRRKQLDIASFDMKHSFLLDNRHPLIRLFLENFHSNQCHQDVEYLRALNQQECATVKLRPNLRSFVSRCIACRKCNAETLAPMMSNLPRERLSYKAPSSSNTGNDYFGPFYVPVKRSIEERWGFLFTSLTTRAVQFEVVPSMDTNSGVM